MRVGIEDVSLAFEGLISGTRSREEVASWASGLRAAIEAEEAVCAPPAASSEIWALLEFLAGVDLKVGPSSYLHDSRDFEAYWGAKRLRLGRHAGP